MEYFSTCGTWRGLQMQADSGKYPGTGELIALLRDGQAAFPPDGPPAWYPRFLAVAETHVHRAIVGEETVPKAIDAIAAAVPPPSER
jgi:hypothetical protein